MWTWNMSQCCQKVPLHWLKQACYKKANMEISDLTTQEDRKTLGEDSTRLFHARKMVNWCYPSPPSAEVIQPKLANLKCEELHGETVKNRKQYSSIQNNCKQITTQAACWGLQLHCQAACHSNSGSVQQKGRCWGPGIHLHTFQGDFFWINLH